MVGYPSLPVPQDLGLPHDADRRAYTAWLIAWLTGLDRERVIAALAQEQEARGINALLNRKGMAGAVALDTSPRYGQGEVPAHLAFMAAEGSRAGVDWAAGIFWAASRYDEAWQTTRLDASPSSTWDTHDRYAADCSPLGQLGGAPWDPETTGLEVPWAHLWARAWAWANSLLIDKGAGAGPSGWPELIPTVDIDNVSAYAGKGGLRVWGGVIRETAALDAPSLLQRLGWLLRGLSIGDRRDPFDHHYELAVLLARYRGRVFWLTPGRGPYDRNLPIDHPVSQRALGAYRGAGVPVCPHPGYDTPGDQAELGRQLRSMPSTGPGEGHARYHYLRGRWPAAHWALVSLGVRHDHTLGYSNQAGYRAGMASPYPAYDPMLDRPTGAWLHPFALMDTHSHFTGGDLITPEVQRVIRAAREVGARGLELALHNQPLRGGAGQGSILPTALLGAWMSTQEPDNEPPKRGSQGGIL